jgi:hypothetical protein
MPEDARTQQSPLFSHVNALPYIIGAGLPLDYGSAGGFPEEISWVIDVDAAQKRLMRAQQPRPGHSLRASSRAKGLLICIDERSFCESPA